MADRTTGLQDRKIHEALVERLGDMSWVFELIEDIAEPDEIFSESRLADWALDNGFVREE